MLSPLSSKFPNSKDLPETFRFQFLHSPEYEYDILVEGELEEVWFRPIWLAPLFKFLEMIGILIAERSHNIKTTLRVVAKYDDSGLPYQLWYRRFFGAKPKKFDVKVIYHPKTKKVIDLVGPFGFLALAWDPNFISPDTLTLDVNDAGLKFGKNILWLPSWFWPYLLGKESFTQKIESEADNLISINLKIRHPIFGLVFGYSGKFKVGKTKHL